MKRYIKSNRDIDDVYMLMMYYPDSGENGPEGDTFECWCKFFASSLEDAEGQLNTVKFRYPDIFKDRDGLYVDKYNQYFDYGDEVYINLDTFAKKCQDELDEYNSYFDEIPF